MADISFTAADVALENTSSPTLIRGLGGESITVGDVCYLDSSDNEYKKAINTDSAKDAVAAIAIQDSADGKAFVGIGTNGDILAGATFTEKTWYCLSSTSGKIMPAADLTTNDYISWIGYGDPDGNLRIYILNTGLQAS